MHKNEFLPTNSLCYIWQFYRNSTDFSTDSKQIEQADWQIKYYMISCFWGWTLHALQASPAHGQFSCQFYPRGSFSLISCNLITSQLRCKSLVASAPIQYPDWTNMQELYTYIWMQILDILNFIKLCNILSKIPQYMKNYFFWAWNWAWAAITLVLKCHWTVEGPTLFNDFLK